MDYFKDIDIKRAAVGLVMSCVIVVSFVAITIFIANIIKNRQEVECVRSPEVIEKARLERQIERIERQNLQIGVAQEIEAKIGRHEVWIGMTEGQLWRSLGTLADDVNESVGEWGTHKQYVYREGRFGYKYVYVENGIVTSWQR